MSSPRSRPIATVALPALEGDLELIDRLPPSGAYSEYSFGRWESHVLANATGDEHDDEFHPYDGTARVTPLGRRLPAIMSMVDAMFVPGAVRWVRAFTLTDGLLMSHVDFIEFDASTARLHVPLRSTMGCLHSEADRVLHLQPGAVWFLDATVPHAACAPPGPSRVSVCIDVARPASDVDACLRRDPGPMPPPSLIHRPPLSDAELAALLQLGVHLDDASLRDVLRLFGMVQFRRQVHAADCLDWLVMAAERSKASDLAARADAFRTYCLHRRAFRERFVW